MALAGSGETGWYISAFFFPWRQVRVGGPRLDFQSTRTKLFTLWPLGWGDACCM